MKSKSKFNSLDRIGRKKTESRKNNKNPPSLVVVDTDEAQTKHNSTLSRKDKKKKRQVNCHPLPVLLMDVLSTLQSGTERLGGVLVGEGGSDEWLKLESQGVGCNRRPEWSRRPYIFWK